MSEFWKSLLDRFTPKDAPLVPLLYPELREPARVTVYQARTRIRELEVRVTFKE